MSKESEQASGDLVAIWDVPLNDGVHRIEFEHGTASGKRIVRVDGKEIIHRDWMFKLVGDEIFNIGNAKCVLKVMPAGAFSFSYELCVNDKSYQKFTEIQRKTKKTWLVELESGSFRVILEKSTLDVWANGENLECTHEFVEDGSETLFYLGGRPACIKTVTSGKRKEGIVHILFVDGNIIEENNSV
ncbi:fas apoptotic inhibitory molecule 1 [Schistocerca americana]|uniref:fas apoptotic inhibitory molecule 1 n=1 Tax=Schistocerca americana TaxID=7009 RepID=UPI001F4F30AA|nr:fas apoptotic inhibitory molecule 1 [Schistocerca americana]XP_047104100.1 fas apoptotic inhibitory molecule 1 [Schistocerca piceifrons]XP_049955796.1 fas apoptotic inhibitory molecule 1 [Schistocerca serialis cubense]